MFKKEISISGEAVEIYLNSPERNPLYQECRVDKVNIKQYDGLLESQGGNSR